MPYERLLRTGRIRAYAAQPSEIAALMQVAHRDEATAEKNLDEAPDWAFSIAYNSVLQAGRALMFHEGYRPRGPDQHATVVEFVDEKLGPAYGEQVRLFDQMRRKRHRVIYEVAGLISRSEAQQAIDFARKFVEEISDMIGEEGR